MGKMWWLLRIYDFELTKGKVNPIYCGFSF